MQVRHMSLLKVTSCTNQAPAASTVTFQGTNGEKVGTFDFSKAPCTFTGDVDASAKLFVDAVLLIWDDRHNHDAVELEVSK